jgi:uncharacterized membrane protein (DUF373 family)
MKKFRIGLIVVAVIVVIGELIIIDYSNLTWSKKMGSYLVIIGMILTISSLISSIRHDKKQQAKLTDSSR